MSLQFLERVLMGRFIVTSVSSFRPSDQDLGFENCDGAPEVRFRPSDQDLGFENCAGAPEVLWRTQTRTETHLICLNVLEGPYRTDLYLPPSLSFLNSY